MLRSKGAGVLAAQGQEVDVRIKWPNDLYGAGLKLGGVLCQSAYREGCFQVTSRHCHLSTRLHPHEPLFRLQNLDLI